jgi:hypothetical protein
VDQEWGQDHLPPFREFRWSTIRVQTSFAQIPPELRRHAGRNRGRYSPLDSIVTVTLAVGEVESRPM